MKFSKPFNLVLSVLMLAFVSSCEWGDRDISVIPVDPDDLAVFYSDTITVKVFNNEQDSIQTSGLGKVYFGRYTDKYVGTITTRSYLIPQLTDALMPDEKAIYDSLVLEVKYNYSYADTTKLQTARVHLLTEDYSPLSTTTYYGHNKLAHDPKVIGSATFRAKPITDTTLSFRLSDDLGRQIFEKGLAKEMGSDNEFKNLIKGFTIQPGVNDDAALLEIEVGHEATALKLYYHLDGPDQITKQSHQVKFTAGFTNVETNRANTPIAGLPTTQKFGLESSSTDHKGFIQSGTGLHTRIDFPYIDAIRYGLGRILINRAYLRINVLRESMDNLLPAPRNLEVFVVNRQNLKTGALTALDGSTVTATYVNDIFNNETYYLVDVTAFITSEKNTADFTGNGIMIQTPAAGMGTSFSRVVFGDQQSAKDKIRLDLYYTYLRD